VRDGRKVSGQSSADAIATGRVLWASEDGPWRGDWTGARLLAQTYNLNYIRGKCVKTIIWSLITSYWDNLPLAGSGVMRANEPWSGFYEIQPALWATAHTTQFTQPGWVYLDGSACSELPGGGSCVTLKSPDSKDYSVIIETIAAKTPQPIVFHLAGLPDKTLSIWRSTEQEQFARIGEITPKQGAFTIELAPDAIYTLSTTTGQRKGHFGPPPRQQFPTTYRDDFENTPVGQLPRLFTDRSGVFEIAKRPDGKGNCLRQVVPQCGIEWVHYKNPHPQTYLGDHSWENYEVKVDALMGSADFVEISGRIAKVPQQEGFRRAPGYWLQLRRDNIWILGDREAPIDCGQIDAAPDQWHELKLSMHNAAITGFIDGQKVVETPSDKHRFGQAGFGCGWGDACFDNFEVIHEPRPVNLALWKPAKASSVWQPTQPTWLDDQLYDAASVTDGRPALTRWSAAAGQLTDQWVEIDFGQETSFDRTLIRQHEDRISAYRLQRWDGANWIDIFNCGNMGIPAREDRFDRVRSSRLRLWIDKVTGSAPPSIWELEVYDSAGK
ncbi:MAG: discoidin domain-containing protein, partial [Tepidisphaeraceae bacterium]